MQLLLASTLEGIESRLGSLFEGKLPTFNVLRIPTAAYGEDNYDWLAAETAALQRHVKSLTDCDISNANPSDIAKALESADLVYVTGGNTYYLLRHIKASGFEKLLIAYLQRGGRYIGCSAGAIVTCPRIDFIADMDNPAKGEGVDCKGLGFVDFLIMPHTDHRKYGETAKAIMQKLSSDREKVIGLRDDQALYIRDDVMEIL